MKRRKFNRPITSTLSRLGFLLNRDLYIYIIDILYEKTTEITTIWQWRTKKRNVKFYLQIRYSQAMYSNNTFFLFYFLLFVTSKRKIQLDPSNFIITFSPTCTKSSVYPKITSSSSPLRSRRPPPSRCAAWAVREWSTGMSPDQTYRLIEQPFWTMKRNKFNEADGACRAGPAGAWKSGRRTKLSSNVARFKKERKKERGRERKKRRGRGGDEARRFETILSNGRSRFVDALHEVTLPESFSSIRENNSFEQREM